MSLNDFLVNTAELSHEFEKLKIAYNTVLINGLNKIHIHKNVSLSQSTSFHSYQISLRCILYVNAIIFIAYVVSVNDILINKRLISVNYVLLLSAISYANQNKDLSHQIYAASHTQNTTKEGYVFVKFIKHSCLSPR